MAKGGRFWIVMLVSACVVAGAVVLLVVVVGPPGPHLTCHRGLVAAMEQWQDSSGSGTCYPNIDGRGQESLAVLVPLMRYGESELRDYRYVPGLCSADPEDLILMYVCAPTPRSWHGDLHWFGRVNWVVISPKWGLASNSLSSEFGQWIDTRALSERLRRTLVYLRENDRPYWTNIVKEHGDFLGKLGPGLRDDQGRISTIDE